MQNFNFDFENYLGLQIEGYTLTEKVGKGKSNEKFVKEDNKNYDELIYGWVSHGKNHIEDFLKYGAALLMFASEIHDLGLVEDIYKKCLKKV